MNVLFDESELLAGLGKLDSRIINAVYDRYYPEVYRYAMYRLGDQTAAEDVASDVFVKLLEAMDKKRGPESNIRGWLIGTASHLVADEFRKYYRKPMEELNASLADHAPGPEEEAGNSEDRQVVRGVYSQLTAEQQEVLALRFGQGYSLEEVSNLMKKNVNAIKALQFRALAALQRGLGEVNNEE